MNDQVYQLVDYIEYQIKQGIGAQVIRSEIVNQGWPANLVDQAFELVALSLPQARISPIQSQQPIEVAPTASDSFTQQNNFTQPSPVAAKPTQDNNNNVVIPKQKYKVFQSLADMFSALKSNMVGFILVFVVSVVMLFAIGLLSTIIGAFIVGLFTKGNLILSLIVIYLTIAVLSSLTTALYIGAQSVSIRDGHMRHKSNVLQVVMFSIKNAPRMTLAYLLTVSAIYGPMILGLILVIFLGLSGVYRGSSALISLGGPLLVLVGSVWGLIAIFRFALAPYVALFEPDVPVTKTLGRSQYLLAKGGQWFLLKGLLFTFVLFVVLGLASGSENLNEFVNTRDAITSGIFIVLSIFINGSMTMLYLNRKAVKG